MAHALAQSQLAAEEEGEGEVGEVTFLQLSHATYRLVTYTLIIALHSSDVVLKYPLVCMYFILICLRCLHPFKLKLFPAIFLHSSFKMDILRSAGSLNAP